MSEQNTIIDPFQAAFEEQAKMLAEQEASKNNSGYTMDYEELKWLSLDVNKWIGFRILGIPCEFRTEAWHPKMILQSKVLKDNKSGYSKINWPYIQKQGKYVMDPDWILAKLYNKVYDKDWIKYTEADINPKEKIMKGADGRIVNAKGYNGYYQEKNTHTQTYQLINFNKKSSEDKSMNNFKPGFRVIMNVISRMSDWCAINKKTMLLSTNVGTKDIVSDKGEKSTISFPQTGISKSMYDEIMYYTKKGNNRWDVDFAILRYQDAQGMYKNDYTDAKLRDRNDASIRDLLTDKPLTKEELEYEKIDIDKITKITSYQKLLKNHVGLFKLFDAEFNQSLTQELIFLADEEKKKYDESKVVEEPKKQTEVVADVPKIETVATPTVQPEVKRERGSVENPIDKLKSLFKFWSNLSKEDEEDVLKAFDKVDVGMVVWKPNTNLIPCDKCSTNLPKTVMHCPHCDADYNS